MRYRYAKAVSLAAVPVLMLTACGGGGGAAEEGDGNGGEGGTIQIDGSSTVAPLSEVAAELFMAENDVQVTVAASGTSGGFERFCNGETDMNDASREISDEEIELCGGNDIAFEGVQIANDALSLVVNPENPLECITVDEANQIWDQDSEVSTWGDVDGLDLPGDFDDADITLYGPGTDSGTFDYFTEAINGEEGQIRSDYTDIGEDDQAAITGVQGDTYAMAYIPYSYVQEAADSVKPLEVDGGDGCVAATLENVQDGSYEPLGRPLFVYASDLALERQETVDFMTFYVDNSDQITETAGFVPMTEEQMADSHAQIEELTS